MAPSVSDCDSMSGPLCDLSIGEDLMRFFRLLSVCFGLLLLTGTACATRMNIGDPDPTAPITPVRSNPFIVTFSGGCSDLLPNSRYTESGCFGFLNRSGSDWDAVQLTLQTDDPKYSFSCNDQPPASPVFATASCGYNATLKEYVLSFSDGLIPANTNQYFVITEDDLPPGELTFTATYSTVTPEPPGITLLGAGGLLLATLVWSRRRALPC